MTVRRLAGFVIGVVMATGPVMAQDAGLKGDLTRDWIAQKGRIVALAEAMPEEKYQFKATPEQRSFSEQLLHLAEGNVNLFKRLDSAGKVPVPPVPADHGRAAVVKFVGDSYDYVNAVVAALPEAALSTPGEGGRTPARMVWAAMSNAANHYGQCVVFLRLNGIIPPASRR